MNTTQQILEQPIYYVYRHIRPDTGEVFYIGIGGGKRANSIFNRNIYWKNIYRINNRQFTSKN